MTTTHTNSNHDKKTQGATPPAAAPAAASAATPPTAPAAATPPAPPAAPDASATPPASATETPAKPVLTKEQKRALFVAYAAVDARYDAAQAQVDTIAKERALAVKAILDGCGSGPFNIVDVPGLEGTQLTAAKRGESYYFRAKKDREVETI